MANKPTAKTISIAAPVGGWNARDPIAAMDELDAPVMDNMFPSTTDVQLRKGYSVHATGLPDIVETLMVYSTFTGETLFAASSGGIYNATAVTAVGTAAITGLTNVQIQYANFTDTTGNQYLHCVNGADAMRVYNGTAWVTVSASSSPGLTGVSGSDIINIGIHVNRLWLVKKNTLSAYYLPSGAAGGAATEFDLGPVFKLGGKLMTMGSWTIDAGEGMDDHAVFITDKGEVAVYKGIDPSSASTWVKVGTYRIAPPIGYRCLVKYAGDLVVITTDGFYPLSKALLSDRTQQAVALSDKIRDAVKQAAETYKTENGWEALFYPGAPFLLFNVPETTGSKQFVMNTLTGAWARFIGWDANCFALFGNQPYWGGDTKVYKGWDTYADDGANITANVLQAYQYFKAPGRVKHFKMARPIILTDGSPGILMAMNVDYDAQEPTSSITFTASTAGVWDSGLWDSATWGGDPSIKRDWQTLGAVGTAGGLRLKTVSRGVQIRWQATDVVFEVGGVI